MRIVLADLKGRSGFVSKDTVAGGYGSRLRPFSNVTKIYTFLKRRFHDVPSVQMAYLAAIADRAGHEVAYTRGEQVDGDVALVLSSLVDHKQEAAWADQARTRGIPAADVIKEIMLKPMPKGVFIGIDELAGITAFLMSPAARNISGQAIVVDGGWTAQ